MVFTVPNSQAHLKKNRFEFKLGDEALSLPKLDFVPADADDFLANPENRNMLQRDFVLGFIDACEPEVGAKVRAAKLHRDQVDAIYLAWGEASKVSVGESSASENS